MSKAPQGTEITPAQGQTAATGKPRTLIEDVRALLLRSQSEIAKALPAHLTPDRVMRVALTTIQQSPDLQSCTAISLVGCIVEASHLGLEIGRTLGQAWLVPYKNNKRGGMLEAQLQIGYKGYLELIHRTGNVADVSAEVVRVGDHFDYRQGTGSFLHFRRALPPMERGDPVAVWAKIAWRSGGESFAVMDWPEVIAFRARYVKGTSGPWWEPLSMLEMAKKTVIKDRLAKLCKLSVEVNRAIELDNAAQSGDPQSLAITPASIGLTRGDLLADRMAAQADQREPEPVPVDLDAEAERQAIQAEQK